MTISPRSMSSRENKISSCFSPIACLHHRTLNIEGKSLRRRNTVVWKGQSIRIFILLPVLSDLEFLTSLSFVRDTALTPVLATTD